MLIVELRPGDVAPSLLNECQGAARAGEFAAAMSAFLSWVAERYESLQGCLQNRVRELRSQVSPRGAYARLPAALAELQCGWEIWPTGNNR